MLTLERFRSLADSYGANLERWPEETRQDARALVSTSQAAQAILTQARALDDVVARAGIEQNGQSWSPADATAALARLRSRVATRIAGDDVSRGRRRLTQVLFEIRAQLAPRLGWGGLLTGGVVAIAAGFVIGLLYASSPPTGSILALLEPTPLPITSDSLK